jgi:hypothetical protein
MYSDLITAIELSDVAKARAILDALLSDGQADSLAIRQALFPVVHRVLNPPFINPHLAKMYAINRELIPFVESPDIALLLRLEVEEYTRREKLPVRRRPDSISSSGTFPAIEQAIAGKDVAGTALNMAAYLNGEGPARLAGRLLLLGSGFLDHSLGHSVSCTAFILLEMINRHDQDPWPVLVLLADYFCKGKFAQTPRLQHGGPGTNREEYLGLLGKAVSGTGIVALHHTITVYAIERSRHLFGPEEYDHMLTMWSHMLADKRPTLRPAEEFTAVPLPDFQEFFAVFSQYQPVPVVNMIKGALYEEDDRGRMSHYLIKSILQCYDGQYDPHYLNGLGAALWTIEGFLNQPVIVLNALLQYLDFFFAGIKKTAAR